MKQYEKCFSVEDVKIAFKNGDYTVDYSKYDTERWRDDKVIDEDKSVRWNREQIEAHNAKIADEIKRRRSDCAKMQHKLMDDCIQGLKNSFKLSDNEAASVYNFCTEHWSDYDDNFFDYLWDIGSLIEGINRG